MDHHHHNPIRIPSTSISHSPPISEPLTNSQSQPPPRRRRAEVVILSPESHSTAHLPPHLDSRSSLGHPPPISPPINLPPTPPTRRTSPGSSLRLVPAQGYFDVLQTSAITSAPPPGRSGSLGLEEFLVSPVQSSESQADALLDPDPESFSDPEVSFLTSLQTGFRSQRRRGRLAPNSPITNSLLSDPIASVSLPPLQVQRLPRSFQAIHHRIVPDESSTDREESEGMADDTDAQFRTLFGLEDPGQTSSLGASLRRRLLAAHEDSDWRQALIEQLHNDVDSGLDRSTAVERLRQRTLDHALSDQTVASQSQPSRRNLMGTLRNLRAQRQYTTAGRSQAQSSSTSTLSSSIHLVYVVYCGPFAGFSGRPAQERLPKGFRYASPSAVDDCTPASSTSTLKGCGQLICVRATIPISTFGHPPTSGVFRNPLPGLLSSDSCPVPRSVGVLDPASSTDFEVHGTRPLKSDLGQRHPCYCTEEYIACLSWCVNIP